MKEVYNMAKKEDTLFRKTEENRNVLYNVEVHVIEGGDDTILEIELIKRESVLQSIELAVTKELFSGVITPSSRKAMTVIFIDIMEGAPTGHITTRSASIIMENIFSIHIGYDLNDELSYMEISLDSKPLYEYE